MTSELSRPPVSLQLEMYRHRTNILYKQLKAENCPTPEDVVVKRNILSGRVDKLLEVEKIFYEELADLLIACKKQKLHPATKTTSTAKPKQTTSSSFPSTTLPVTTSSTELTAKASTTTVSTTTTVAATTTATATTTTSSTSNVSDCHSLWERGVRTDGVYTLTPEEGKTLDAWCQFDATNGWTVIQKRYDGSVDFYRYWADYKSGFGEPEGEYWLGNDNIYTLTRTNMKLSIYLRRYDGQEGTANYSTFYINNERDNYRLTIAGYSGSVGDQLDYHNNQQFTTRDRDHDGRSANCAVYYTGAWWYKNCYHANLNGVWTSSSSGIRGNIALDGSWGGSYSQPLQRSTMRVSRD